jgi:uncharacterized protein (DUF1330 family)
MTVYAIAQLSIHDRERYERYVTRFMPVLSKYHGRLLAADEHPLAVEGSFAHDKLILLAFDDKHAFERWAHSEEYVEISRDRKAATDGSVLLVRGFRGES